MNKSESAMPRSATTVETAAGILNELLTADPRAMQELINARVKCNQALADHPTAQTRRRGPGHEIGLLGVINAIFGKNADGAGAICAEIDDNTGAIVRFCQTPEVERDAQSPEK